MSLNFEELDFQHTPIGDISLRRRRMSQFPDQDIYEVKLGNEFLMTSIFHESETQLSKLALEKISTENLNVVVGGLGLGYTAAAALEDPRVKSLTIVEYLEPVINWHKRKIVPVGGLLVGDSRCSFIQGDFFALARDFEKGFNASSFEKKDLILLDIDHTPSHVLHESNRRFYTEEGLNELKGHLTPDGIFGLWADGRPDPDFTKHLKQVFATAEDHAVEFNNPLTKGTSICSVYLATMQ